MAKRKVPALPKLTDMIDEAGIAELERLIANGEPSVRPMKLCGTMDVMAALADKAEKKHGKDS